MALKTWKFKLGEKEISVKAKKEDAENFGRGLRSILSVPSMTKELDGIIGVTEGYNRESSHVMQVLFGKSDVPMTDPEGYAKDVQEFTEALPVMFDASNMPEWSARAAAIIKKHMPVRDNRKTQAQYDADQAKYRQDEQEREEKRRQEKEIEATQAEEYLKLYPHLVPISKSGKSSHAAGSANIKAELERKFPGVTFSVKSDSFSGGNSIDVKWQDGPTVKQVEEITGKYSYGTFDGMTDIYNYDRDRAFANTFGGAKYIHESRNETYEFYAEIAAGMGLNMNAEEIKRIAEHRDCTELESRAWQQIRQAAQDIAKLPDPSTVPAQAAPSTVGGVTVRRNPELNGIEILFSAKPEREVIDRLKAHGFRWSPKNKLWYAKQSDSRISFAESLQQQAVAA